MNETFRVVTVVIVLGLGAAIGLFFFGGSTETSETEAARARVAHQEDSTPPDNRERIAEAARHIEAARNEQAAMRNLEGDTPCERAYSLLLQVNEYVLAQERAENPEEAPAESTVSDLMQLPPRGRYLAECQRLPEASQRCLVPEEAGGVMACQEALTNDAMHRFRDRLFPLQLENDENTDVEGENLESGDETNETDNQANASDGVAQD